MVKPDPAIDEVREARRKISEKFGHDPARLIDHYIKLQEAYRDRLFKEESAPQRSVA